MFRVLTVCLGLVAIGGMAPLAAQAQEATPPAAAVAIPQPTPVAGAAIAETPAVSPAVAAMTATAPDAAQPQSAMPTPANNTVAKQAIIIDYDTGMVLFEKNADERMPTSSMSKVITIYMVFEALKEGKLHLDDKLLVSERAWRMQGSKMFVKVGDQVRVEDLIQGVVVQSGNDATVVLAEGLRGSEEAFAEAATAKARELGMKNSNFMNASGWPDPNHYSTARDLAILAYHIIHDFPEYYHYFGEIDYTYNNIKQGNRNPLLYHDIGADGLKTGHTEDGGYGLMGSAINKDGRRVIAVLNGMSSMDERAQEGVRLIDWGLKSFDNLKLFKAGETVDQVPVVLGTKETVPAVVEQDVIVTLPLSVRNDLKVTETYDSPLLAPVKKGQKLGTVTVEIPRVSTMTLPLVAGEDIGHLGFFASTMAKAKFMVNGKIDEKLGQQ